MPPEPPSNPSNPNTNNANATQPDLTKPPTPPRVSQTYHIAKRLDALGISAQYLEDEHLNIFRAALVNEKTWDTFYALQGNPTMAGLEGANFVASWRARTSACEELFI